LAQVAKNTITIADKVLKTSSEITDEVRRAEKFISEKYEDFKKVSLIKNKSKNNINKNIEQEVILLLINITTEYLEEKDKIKELKKEMNIKIDSLINRVKLLL
jgi:cell division protein ZapA (FtsZ GTPase activity inhibitor)